MDQGSQNSHPDCLGEHSATSQANRVQEQVHFGSQHHGTVASPHQSTSTAEQLKSNVQLPSAYIPHGHISGLATASPNDISIHAPINAWQPISPPGPFQNGELDLCAAVKSKQSEQLGPVPFVPSHMPVWPSQMSPTEFDESFPPQIPEELRREPDGVSVIEHLSYVEENGRTYHGYKEGKYYLPNDPAEQDRLDLQHAVFTMALDGRLALAPMAEPPKFAMDVATGTGIWAIEFAKQNPASHVIGTDLSKIQPDPKDIGVPNVEWFREDADDEWQYAHLPGIDYIHLRAVCMSFDDPKRVLKEAVKNLNPGGWVEYHDMAVYPFSTDGTHEGTFVDKYWALMRAGLQAKGRSPDVTLMYKTWLEQSGLEEVTELTFMIPGNEWPQDPKLKRIGQYFHTDLYNGVRGACWQLFRNLGLLPEEIEDIVNGFKKDSSDLKSHVWYRFHVVYGRKPIAAGNTKSNSV